MMARNLHDALKDMLRAIDSIEKFTDKYNFDTFEKNDLVRSAVERKVEIVSEASRSIPEEYKDRFPHNWRGLSDIGNFIRHKYDAVNPKYIWDVAKKEMPNVKKIANTILLELDKSKGSVKSVDKEDGSSMS